MRIPPLETYAVEVPLSASIHTPVVKLKIHTSLSRPPPKTAAGRAEFSPTREMYQQRLAKQHAEAQQATRGKAPISRLAGRTQHGVRPHGRGTVPGARRGGGTEFGLIDAQLALERLNAQRSDSTSP